MTTHQHGAYPPWGLVLAIIVLFCCGARTAQAQLMPVQQDSLIAELAVPHTPFERLKILRALSRSMDMAVREEFASKGMRLADSLLALGTVHDSITMDHAASLAYNWAWSQQQSGRTQEAKAGYAIAAERWRSLGNADRQGWAIHGMARELLVQGRLDSAAVRYRQAIGIFRTVGDTASLIDAEMGLGVVRSRAGRVQEALDQGFGALALAERTGMRGKIGNALLNIGKIYGDVEQLDSAIAYQLRSFEFADSTDAPTACNNIAADYIVLGRYAEADAWLDRGIAIAEPRGHPMIAWLYRNKCDLYRIQGRPSDAVRFGEKAYATVTDNADLTVGLSVRSALGMAYLAQSRYDKALSIANECSALMPETGNFDLRLELEDLLYQLHKKTGATDLALLHHERFMLYKDSLASDQHKKQAVRSQFQYEYDKQRIVAEEEQKRKDAITQAEMHRQKMVRNGFMGGFALVAVFAGVFFFQRNRISKARKRSDELLLNILPEEVAQELKDTGAAQAKHFDSATILFSDFKGFTSVSEQLSPQELVEELNTCFKAFDHIITVHGIEKIKTIGDAYMCAGGLPDPSSSSPADVVHAALEMQAFMIARKSERDAQGKPAFEMRVGIHTGPVVAGIVGLKKFAYDIWGDTVNIASRMESSGEVGQVNISEATYALVKDESGLAFTSRGKVQAKGKGELEMYFVERSMHGG